MRALAGVLGLVLALLLGLFGAFSVRYQEGSGGDEYVNLAGTNLDADYLGIALIVVALALLVLSLWALRHGGVP
jgi:uncharacterized protein HemY